MDALDKLANSKSFRKLPWNIAISWAISVIGFRLSPITLGDHKILFPLSICILISLAGLAFDKTKNNKIQKTILAFVNAVAIYIGVVGFTGFVDWAAALKGPQLARYQTENPNNVSGEPASSERGPVKYFKWDWILKRDEQKEPKNLKDQ